MERIDSYFAKLWSIPLRWLCATTGKDNFFFSRCALLAGCGSFTYFFFLDSLGSATEAVGAGLSSAGLCVIQLLIDWFLISPLKRSVEEGDRALPEEYSSVTFYRLSYVAVFLLAAMEQDWLALVPMLLFLAWLYFATDFRPASKSLVRRGIERLSSKPSVGRVIPEHAR